MALRPTNATDNIAEGTCSLCSVFSTARRTASAEAPTLSTALEIATTSSPLAALDSRVFRVSLDDLPDEAVPHHVRIGEIMEADSLDASEDSLHLKQS